MSDRKSKVYIAVSKEPDGRTIRRELCINGYKQCEMSALDVIELIMQATSSLRFKDGQA